MDEIKSQEPFQMSQSNDIRSPLPDDARFANMLSEQGEDEESVRSLVPTLARLGEWQSPSPSRDETAQLISRLVHLLPDALSIPALRSTNTRMSDIRQTLRTHFSRPRSQLRWLLELTLLQGLLVRPSFWLSSAFISVLGVFAVVLGLPGSSALILRLLGPLLSVLAVGAVFRSVRLNMLEIELSCPISPLRLTITRLALVLGYDVLLGLVLSCVLSLLDMQGSRTSLPDLVLTTVGHWLAPLLLVAGLTLLFCLRVSVETAMALAYGVWLLILTPAVTESASVSRGDFTTLVNNGELAIGAAGIAFGVVALLRMRSSIPLLLPRG